MPNLPVISSFWNYLTEPSWPNTAVSIGEFSATIATLRRRGKEFEPRNFGLVRYGKGLVQPHFSEPNILNEVEFIASLRQAMEQANLRRVGRVTVGLPAGSARSLVFSLETLPESKTELAEMIEWKIERSVGASYQDLRCDCQRLRDFNGRSQWLVAAVHQRVAEQYEAMFKELGWQVGLMLPQALGEAQWLMRAGVAEDQVLVSIHPSRFDTVIVRGQEPILVREVICAPEEREDEFFRLLVFYRDRLIPEGATINLARVLTLGDAYEQRRFREVLYSALDQSAVSLEPQHLGLRVEPQAPFRELAAAAGLATFAWS